MNATNARLSFILLLAVSFGFAVETRAQTASSQGRAQVSLAPMQLFDQLMSRGREPQSSEQRAAALKELGIESPDLERFRLTFEDLDGDGSPEALFTVDLDFANVTLVVLKRRGNQWYRLASPPEFSCWCKYESSPLDSFAEVRGWFYGKNEPAKLVFVRGSGGGTGLYDRGLQIYTLQGYEMKRVFFVTEERRECGWPDNHCDLSHVEVTAANEGQPALVAAGYEKHLASVESSLNRNTWWIGLPVRSCKAYTWNAQRQEFSANPAANTTYCNPLGK
jgi:hypothetical protein